MIRPSTYSCCESYGCYYNKEKMSKFWNSFGFIFEYQTPRVVTLRHYKLGIFRLILQSCILAFIFIFQLWYKKGYQSFSDVEASVTTKVNKTFKYTFIIASFKVILKYLVVKYYYFLYVGERSSIFDDF